MKKFFLVIVLTAVLLGLFAKDELVWCTRLLLERATVHTIQPGDYFSKLSQHYYGTAAYWSELALVNRAPNSDLVFPGEKVMIPSREAIEKLHLSRSLSAFNRIVQEQQTALAPEPAQETALSRTTPPEALDARGEQLDPKAVSSLQPAPAFSWPMALLMALALVLLAAAVYYTIKWRREKSKSSSAPPQTARERQFPEPSARQKEHALVN